MKKRSTFVKILSLGILLLFCAVIGLKAQDIMFLVQSDNDDYEIQFLEDQGFTVEKFTYTGSIADWGQDTLDMLDDADLVVVGRTVGSGSVDDSAKRAKWNAITSPLIEISPFSCRSTRNHMFNSASLRRMEFPNDGIATALLPADGAFDDVTLDGDQIKWLRWPTELMTDGSGTSNGEWVVSVDDTVPFLVRFAPLVPYYDGGPDSAVAERVYIGFGGPPVGEETDESGTFPLTRDAKQVILNEVNRLVGNPQATAVFGQLYDFDAIFVANTNSDTANYSFLRRQGLVVNEWRNPDGIGEATAEERAALDAADLVIIGRTPGSGEFQDSIERARWNAVETPVIWWSPFHLRSTRIQFFNSTTLGRNVHPGPATAMIPGDAIFDNVTLDGANEMDWLLMPTDYMTDATGTSNGEWVVGIDDTIALLVRFAPNVPFYVGSEDSAVAERVTFASAMGSTGNFSDANGCFPLTREAKQVYLNEVCRLLGDAGFAPAAQPTAQYGSYDYQITFLKLDNDKDDTQIDWLETQGFTINPFWREGDINTWSAGAMDTLNASELIIAGRSLESGSFQDSIERVTWHSITAPLLMNGIHPCRSTRNKWFNTTSALKTQEGMEADVLLADDEVLDFAGGLPGEWLVGTSDYLRDTNATNATIVVANSDHIPLVARFDEGVEFYPGVGESPDGDRVYFAFGAEPGANYFPLSGGAQAVYYAEILRMLGGVIGAPILYETGNSIAWLSVDPGTLVPAFDAAEHEYTVTYTETTNSITIDVMSGTASATIIGDGIVAIPSVDTTLRVMSKSEIGQENTYVINIVQPAVQPAIEDNLVNPSLSIYPNPFTSNITVSSTEAITNVTVYNVHGAKVMNVAANNNDVELDLSTLNSGVYIIRVQSNSTIYNQKIIKQ